MLLLKSLGLLAKQRESRNLRSFGANFWKMLYKLGSASQRAELNETTNVEG